MIFAYIKNILQSIQAKAKPVVKQGRNATGPYLSGTAGLPGKKQGIFLLAKKAALDVSLKGGDVTR